MSEPDIIIPARLLTQLLDAVSAKRPSVNRMRTLVGEMRNYRDAGNTISKPWAIVQGGLIQDSEGVEYIDLDWMDNGHVASLEETEDAWTLLTRVVRDYDRDGWGGELHEVEEMLTTYYGDNDTPEDRKVWNRS